MFISDHNRYRASVPALTPSPDRFVLKQQITFLRFPADILTKIHQNLQCFRISKYLCHCCL